MCLSMSEGVSEGACAVQYRVRSGTEQGTTKERAQTMTSSKTELHTVLSL